MCGDEWLVGWVAIGKYLGISHRTAYKWHRRYGLPIVRSPGGMPAITKGAASLWIYEFDRLIPNEKLMGRPLNFRVRKGKVKK